MRKRVLIAEDILDNREVLVKRLRRIGSFVIDEAATGLDAIRLASENSPDLIIMDMDMPVMDGYQATKAIRGGSNGTSRVPIIALTAACLSTDIERCSRAGASDYISKPITDPDKLRSKVLFWLGLDYDPAFAPQAVTHILPPTRPRVTESGH